MAATVTTPRVSTSHVRTTIVLPAALDQNLEIFCAQNGSTKNKAVIQALYVMLKKAGLNPTKLPTSVKFNVSYD
jgi:hypothetical protein